jgi:hypothetical protein
MVFSSNVVRVSESPLDDATTSKINTIEREPTVSTINCAKVDFYSHCYNIETSINGDNNAR